MRRDTEDEIQTFATAFNRMAGRLEEQTSALRSANTQLEPAAPSSKRYCRASPPG